MFIHQRFEIIVLPISVQADMDRLNMVTNIMLLSIPQEYYVSPQQPTLVSVHCVLPHSRECGITLLKVLMSKDSANNCGELADQAEKKMTKAATKQVPPNLYTNQCFSIARLSRYINRDMGSKEIMPSTKLSNDSYTINVKT